MKKETLNDLKFLGILLVVIVGICLYTAFTSKNEVSDAKKFSLDYTEVGEDNIFVYRTDEEIIKILEGGTGIVFFGFPECPWCQAYAPMLNEVAKESGIEEIYYYNIKDIRKANTENYQKIVSILKDYLPKDKEGNERVTVPDVTIIKEGKILSHDNETSVIDGEITPSEYWTEEKKNDLKNRLKTMIEKANLNSCTTCDE